LQTQEISTMGRCPNKRALVRNCSSWLHQ